MESKGRKVYEAECPWCFFNFCHLISTCKHYTQYSCYLCGIPFRHYAGRELYHHLYVYEERKGERIEEED
jgi:hypothetical protein